MKKRRMSESLGFVPFSADKKICCIICHSVLSDDTVFIHCGHVFHYNCLSRWLNRSNTCPQCRNMVTINTIHKVHFTVSEIADDTEDCSCCLRRINSLKSQIRLKEGNIDYYASENESLMKQNAGLEHKVQKMEREVYRKNMTISILKRKVEKLQENCSEHEVIQQKLSVREGEVKQFQSMHKSLLAQLLTQLSTIGDVQEIVGETTEKDALHTYISVMIKIISEKVNEVKNLQDQVTKHRDSSVEERFERLQSEKTLLALLGPHKNDNLFLQDRVNELGKLFITSDQNHVQNLQINTKQKTADQNDPSSPKTEAEVITDANQENSVRDSTIDERPIVTKKPRLQSGNSSDKNYLITSAVISTTGIKSQSKRKETLKLKSLS